MSVFGVETAYPEGGGAAEDQSLLLVAIFFLPDPDGFFFGEIFAVASFARRGAADATAAEQGDDGEQDNGIKSIHDGVLLKTRIIQRVGRCPQAHWPEIHAPGCWER